MVLMTATNLFSVKSYGEFEFWFAGIKVAAILVFIAIGACFVLGLWPSKSADFSNLWSQGGFMPMGAGVITVGIVTVIFSMVGAGDRHDRRRRVVGPREGRREGRQLGDLEDPCLLRRSRFSCW